MIRAAKPSLTGLRGVAAVGATLFHFKINSAFFPLDRFPLGADVIDRGYLAVDLFFVLSGFVMALSYAPMFDGRFERRTYGLFLRRRLARVYPLYLVMTLASAGVLWLHAGQPRFDANLWLNVLMIQAWGLSDSLDGPAWSISTEWAAYLLFPVLAKLALFRGLCLAVLLAIICCVIITMIAALPDQDVVGRLGGLDAHDSASGVPLLRCLSEFCLGLLAYRVAPLLGLAPPMAAAITSIAAALIIVLLTLPGTDVAVVLLFAVLILGLSHERGLVAKMLGGPVLHGLGVLSYAIYLLHFRFIWLERVTRHHLPATLSADSRQAIALVLVSTLLLAASFCAYVGIEKPGRRWLRTAGTHHSSAPGNA